MSDLVVGAVAHFSWEIIQPWVVSLERSRYVGQKAVIASNLAPDVIERLIERGFHIKHVAHHKRLIHVERFFSLWQLLHEVKARYVIATDTKDLIFQTNPSIWLEEHLAPFDLTVGSECVTHKDTAFNDQGMLAAFGPDVHAWMKDKLVYNAGNLAGEANTVRDLCLTIYLMCCQNAYSNPDQFALNVLLNLSPWNKITRFSSMADGWACQVANVADPVKLKTVRPYLKEPEPVLGANGFVYPADSNTPFCMVHQYDRNPLWRAVMMSKYRE